MYCDDEDTGKKVAFNKDHMEGMIRHKTQMSIYLLYFFYELPIVMQIEILQGRFRQLESKPSLCYIFRVELSSNSCYFF